MRNLPLIKPTGPLLAERKTDTPVIEYLFLFETKVIVKTYG